MKNLSDKFQKIFIISCSYLHLPVHTSFGKNTFVDQDEASISKFAKEKERGFQLKATF